jgi:hypothetical protein
LAPPRSAHVTGAVGQSWQCTTSGLGCQHTALHQVLHPWSQDRARSRHSPSDLPSLAAVLRSNRRLPHATPFPPQLARQLPQPHPRHSGTTPQTCSWVSLTALTCGRRCAGTRRPPRKTRRSGWRRRCARTRSPPRRCRSAAPGRSCAALQRSVSNNLRQSAANCRAAAQLAHPLAYQGRCRSVHDMASNNQGHSQGNTQGTA